MHTQQTLKKDRGMAVSLSKPKKKGLNGWQKIKHTKIHKEKKEELNYNCLSPSLSFEAN